MAVEASSSSWRSAAARAYHGVDAASIFRKASALAETVGLFMGRLVWGQSPAVTNTTSPLCNQDKPDEDVKLCDKTCKIRPAMLSAA